MTDATPKATLGGKPAARAKTPAWLGWVIAVLFGLFFAFDFWEALGNFIGLSQYAGLIDTTLNTTGYVAMVIGLLIPILCFVVALIASRRSNPLAKFAIFLIALCVCAALSLDVQLIFDPSRTGIFTL